jgi:hypothetical protein
MTTATVAPTWFGRVRSEAAIDSQADALLPGAVDEQRYRVRQFGRRRAGVVFGGQRQRRDPVDGLPADPERLGLEALATCHARTCPVEVGGGRRLTPGSAPTSGR